MEQSLVGVLIELAKNAGPYAIVIVLLIWLYWRADKERRDLNTQLLELSKTASTAAQTWAEILNKSYQTRGHQK